MKVLMLNGSSKQEGCTYTALSEISKELLQYGIESEIVYTGGEVVCDCTACGACVKLGKCVYNDIVNIIVDKAREADGFIFGTPVYYAHPSGRIRQSLTVHFIQVKVRLFTSPLPLLLSARRAGTTASLDVLNKYFAFAEMPVVSSSYWNVVHGTCPDDVKKDLEGLQTMRNLARNMAWLLQSIEAGKNAGVTVPTNEAGNKTNFIR